MVKALDIARVNLSKHGAELSKNEAMKWYMLVDLVLKALGWDVSDPDNVIPEEGSSAAAGSTTRWAGIPWSYEAREARQIWVDEGRSETDFNSAWNGTG